MKDSFSPQIHILLLLIMGNNFAMERSSSRFKEIVLIFLFVFNNGQTETFIKQVWDRY